jgi:membrane protease YdiL (CAAX protease family)
VKAFWGADDLLLWIGLAVPSLLLSSLVARLFPFARAPKQMAAQFLFYLLWFVALKLILLVKYQQRFWWSLGWVIPDKGLWLCMIGGPVLAVGLNVLAKAMKTPAVKPPFEGVLFDQKLRILFGVAAVLAGPLAEELAFRGFLLPLLAKWLGVAAGIVVTGLAFASMHGPQYQWHWQYIALLTVAGSLFGLARWRYESTMPAMVLHASFNLTVFLAQVSSL